MIYYLIYFALLVIGGLANLFNKDKQFIIVIISIIVGFWVSYLQNNLSIWFSWFCWTVGFIAVKLMTYQRKTDKQQNKKRGSYNHYFIKDANGNHKLHSYKIIDGEKSSLEFVPEPPLAKKRRIN